MRMNKLKQMWKLHNGDKRNFDKHRQDVQFKIGKLVLINSIIVPGQADKFMKPYKGPAYVSLLMSMEKNDKQKYMCLI